MSSEYLKKLRELTNDLPLFPKEVFANNVPFREYPIYGEGVCFGWLVFEIADKIAVHRWYNSKSNNFPIHTHKCREYFFVYEGEMDLAVEDKIIPLKLGDTYYVNPGVAHGAIFKNIDTKYLTITIPPAEGFPYVK